MVKELRKQYKVSGLNIPSNIMIYFILHVCTFEDEYNIKDLENKIYQTMENLNMYGNTERSGII